MAKQTASPPEPAAAPPRRKIKMRTGLAELGDGGTPIARLPGEVVEKPEPEAERLCWRGLAEPVDWTPRACPPEHRGDAEVVRENLKRRKRTPETAEALDERKRQATEEASTGAMPAPD